MPATLRAGFTSPSELEDAVERQIQGRAVATWLYWRVDEDGEATESFSVTRFDLDAVDPETGKVRKEFRPAFWRSSESGGEPRLFLGYPEGARVLYALPEVLAAPLGETVFVCEGEKAADVLRKEVGVVATTCAGGCNAVGKSDWSPLSGRPVVVLPDNDPGGERWARRVLEMLRGKAASVEVILLPDLPSKGDAVEYVMGLQNEAQRLKDECGPDFELDLRSRLLGDVARLREDHADRPSADRTAPEDHLPTIRLLTPRDLLSMPPPQYLVDRVLPVGSLAVLYGSQGIGKSFVALDLAWCVAAGHDWLGRSTCSGTVVYVIAEGGRGFQKRIRARLAGSPDQNAQNRLLFSRDSGLLDEDRCCELLEQLQTVDDLRLVVFDTLARSMTGDESSSKDMGNVIRGIEHIQLATGAACLLVHHVGKEQTRGMRGSSALPCAADSVMRLKQKGGRGQGILLENEKQKDDDLFEPIPLVLEEVSLGDGTSSCIVRSGFALEGTSGSAEELVVALCRVLARDFDGREVPSTELVDRVCEAAGTSKTRAKAALRDALSQGRVACRVDGRRRLYRRLHSADADQPTGATKDR